MEYMSFAYAKLLPLTDKRQSSLAAASTRTAEVAKKKKKTLNQVVLESSRIAISMAPNITSLKNRSAFDIAQIKCVRDTVVCNDGLRARCIYNDSVVSHMRPPPPSPPLDPETRPDAMRVIIEAEMKRYKALAKYIPVCCYCAATSKSPITVHNHLMTQNGGSYSVVLHIREEGIAAGRHILVRGER